MASAFQPSNFWVNRTVFKLNLLGVNSEGDRHTSVGREYRKQGTTTEKALSQVNANQTSPASWRA